MRNRLSIVFAAFLALMLLTGAALPVLAAEPPPPGAPAVYAGSVSRIRGIEGDSFAFEQADGKTVRIRLLDADCEGMGQSARENAKSLATNLLQTKPVWILPCGKAKGPTGDEVYALVWTEKGFLSEVMIKGACAQRRAALSTLTLDPVEASADAGKGPVPEAPAFAAGGLTVIEGDTFEFEQAGRKVQARLYDVSSQDVEADQREAAKATATRLLEGTVWVFPCMPRRNVPGEVLPVRIWTREGWLCEALVKAGQAKRIADPLKAAVAAGAAPKPDAAKKPDTAAKPPATPEPVKEVKWRVVPVSKGAAPGGGAASSMMGTGGTTGQEVFSCRSTDFQIKSTEWRISWDIKPTRNGSAVSVSIWRVDDTGSVRLSSTHVGSFTGTQGARVIKGLRPGKYWIKIAGSAELGVKVEERE